ncbi:aminoacyl-tRNA hydrolase [Candidatus Dependentiae bacterium]|nr:aminoacyl-tRNA hydrolase [Candidatus Dependentiae bacterium]
MEQNTSNYNTLAIKAIIGLGNPGLKFEHNRHNIGFLVVDALSEKYGGTWQHREHMEYANILINNKKIILIKPQTFMNTSGKVIPWLIKQGVNVKNILVVHDELEKKFGNISIRFSGSSRGHNGLRSIMSVCGPDFARLRFGIGRPERKENVGEYVLQNFTEPLDEVQRLIDQAVDKIILLFN